MSGLFSSPKCSRTIGAAIYFLLVAIACPVGLVPADEGMFPISEIGSMDLKARGLELTAKEIFNTEATCLVDGIVRVNGCTGSFVSPDGLIITNHHCAYRAIQSASSQTRDYLADGFQAKDREQEIPSKGYTVRITEAYQDVSKQVLSVVTAGMDFTERTVAIEKQSKELQQQAEKENPGMRAEVAEMFIGETYGLFLYTYIKDVRLVFAPPASVGNFGGENDNWEWPRHTGDFSFMRAYVAPDGSTADYSPENVPYQPKRFIQVAPAGVDSGDFIMLLGYPGRTARHKTAEFLAYERDHRLPAIVDLYQWQIALMEAASENDRGVALKHADRIKGLANVEKRSRGQLKGLNRAKLVQKRAAEEAMLQAYIDAVPERSSRYGKLLPEIAAVYQEMAQSGYRELIETNMVSACRTLNLAYTVYDAAKERQKEDLDRESAYMDRNFDQTVQQLLLAQNDLDIQTDTQIMAGMMEFLAIAKGESHDADAKVQQDMDDLASEFFQRTKFSDQAFLQDSLSKSVEELEALDDSAIKMVVSMYPRLMEIRSRNKQREGQLNQLYGDLITVKKQFLSKQFVPDANGTLRLTIGSIKGFSPEDAVYKSPITTLRGVIEKTTGKEPFVTPSALIERYEAGDFGSYVHPKLGQVPVNILYDSDTTGGNSGSPILNAKGELVGVNFDRAFEATINDFAWNEGYSRSIGVDIRYVLWITGTVFQAQHLLEEMGVQ